MKNLIKISIWRDPTVESKGKIKKYEELWSKVKDLLRSITNNSDGYYDKYIKMRIDSDDDLLLNKMIEIDNTAVRAIFMKITNIILNFSLMNVYMNYKQYKNDILW